MRQREWLAAHGSSLLGEVIEAEIASGERVVEINEHWLAAVPWWAA